MIENRHSSDTKVTYLPRRYALRRARVAADPSRGWPKCSRVLCALVVVLVACNTGPVLCPAWIPPPILVEVRDRSTGAPAAQGAGGWINDGSFTSPVLPAQPGEPLVLASAGGPGFYEVVVQKAGYSTWTRRGIWVRGGSCGVNKSVHLKADLQPLG